jgi:3-methyl-2-oxobutanoate hydroxymethyltransferase
MAHLGLQPQKFSSSKNFKIFGKNRNDLENIINDSIILQNAGAVALLLEGMKTKIAKKITTITNIPTIGIGASEFCDGQILVSEDMLGVFTEYHPKFVKKYTNLSHKIKIAVKKYVSEIDQMKFPNKNYRYD